jgi:hypothetical protein
VEIDVLLRTWRDQVGTLLKGQVRSTIGRRRWGVLTVVTDVSARHVWC